MLQYIEKVENRITRMSDEMEVSREGENRKDSTEEMELGAATLSENGNESTGQKDDGGVFGVKGLGTMSSARFSANNLLKLDIAKNKSKVLQTDAKTDEAETSGFEMSKVQKSNDCKHSPPVFSDSQTYSAAVPNSNDDPFQKPSVCRTHSLGGSDSSPFVIRRRPGKLAFSNPLQSPSAFRCSKLRTQSPIRPDLLDEMEDSALKRCNSAPMLSEINDIDTRMPWHHGSVTPGSVRARRFSATVLSSPSSGSAKSTSRLHQLKKEESLEGIQHKETAHEREVQTSLQMYHTCEELTLFDDLNGSEAGAATSGGSAPRTAALSEPSPRSPLPSTAPVSLPVSNKHHAPTRAIDFTLSNSPLHNLHPSGGSIPSPLTISTGPQCQTLLPPSPTRNLGFSSTGKQCFSPSMQVHIPAQYLRPGSLSPSPSPTRRTFVTRRRSQSPCVVKPSALGQIKRKHDSDSEGGCSPKRIFIQSSHATVGHTQGESFQYNVVMPHFSRNAIHRSHSLSSSSLDSDINISPSPQNVVSIGFQPSAHPLGAITNPHHPRDGRTGSPFQPPTHVNNFSAASVMQELTRCSSPASSTCSSSSLEGLKDLPPFPQSLLATHSSNNPTPTLSKQAVKERQPSGASVPIATMNVTL